MSAKETAMIELTSDQAQTLDRNGGELPLVVHPRTGEKFVLVPKDVYDRMQKWVAPLKRGWDNPADDDLTRKPS
jgi:hypothetical protein